MAAAEAKLSFDVIIIIIIIHSIYIAPFNDPRTHTRAKRQRGGDRG